jgi:hypothetical protein
MHFTLSKNEYREIMVVKYLEAKKFDEEFIYLNDSMEDCTYWAMKISGLNHLLSIILEQFEKKSIPTKPAIDFVYQMHENLNFEIQEGDIQFVESLFDNDLNTSITLEEELIIAENRIYATR